MKTLISGLQLLCLFLLISSCKKDPAPQPPPTATNKIGVGQAGGTVANKPWRATTAYAKVKNGRFEIYCESEDGKTLILDLAGTKVAHYKINQFQPSTATFDVAEGDDTLHYTGAVDLTYTGDVHITAYDQLEATLSGTFDLVLKEKTSGKLITIEDGILNEVPVTSATFELFAGYAIVQDGADGEYQFSTIDITPFGEISYTPNVNNNVVLDQKSKSNYSFFDKTTAVYGFGDPSNRSFYSMKLPETPKNGTWNYPGDAPVAMSGNSFAFHPTTPTGYIYQIHPLSGDSIDQFYPVPLNSAKINPERISSAQDGTNLYFLTGTSLSRLNVTTSVVKTFDLDPSGTSGLAFNGIEVIAENELLAIRSENDGKYAFVKITTGGATAQVTTMYEFTYTGCIGCNYSSVYDKTKNVYYLFTYYTDSITQDITTTIRAYNLSTNKLSLITIGVNIFGVELRD